ncbi:tyrosine-protein phosphatase [Demequina sp.]|uniref:tyrosine-protein phosphatase n=1 Tax=Demequina sp. TaxID=2050685 RepID=UPI003D0F9988
MSSLANARDIASAAPGLRPGQYLRSDAPMVGDDPPPALPWPPANVYDLRDPSESEGPHGLDGVAHVHHVKVFADAAIGELIKNAGTTTLADMYQTLIASPQAEVLTGVVRGIASDATPVLVHCSAGKDRAGVTAALVLALVGAPREAIVADYVATAANMGGVMARFLSAMPVEMRAQMEAAAPRGGSTELLDAPASAIEGVLDAWDAWDDGVEGWYLAHGGDAETLGSLRARLLA